MNSPTWPLVLPNDDGIRPAGRQDECFYCQQKIGQPHRQNCVIIKKKVKIRATIEYEIEVPHYWDSEQIEFHRNESSSCASNMLEELKEIDSARGCLCGLVKFKYLGTTDETPTRKTIDDRLSTLATDSDFCCMLHERGVKIDWSSIWRKEDLEKALPDEKNLKSDLP